MGLEVKIGDVVCRRIRIFNLVDDRTIKIVWAKKLTDTIGVYAIGPRVMYLVDYCWKIKSLKP